MIRAEAEEFPPSQLIIEPRPLSGETNMRTDESLLEAVVESNDHSFVRIYRWASPTVSVGYFQAIEDVPSGKLSTCDRVRRLTGGGAILHHNEVTYSVALPACHPFRKSPLSTYDIVHTHVVRLLEQLGFPCAMRKNASIGSENTSNHERDTFLCFLRMDPRDIVSTGDSFGTKIVGSAQRRRKGSVLQHGSILLKSSPHAPELTGITDISPRFPVDEFCDLLPEAINKSISTPTNP